MDDDAQLESLGNSLMGVIFYREVRRIYRDMRNRRILRGNSVVNPPNFRELAIFLLA